MSFRLEKISRTVDGVTRIHEVSLQFEAGCFNILLGATHAGKTQLIKLMAGITHPTSGRLFLDGKDITHVPPQKRQIGLVHENFVNYPHLNVYENIASPLRVARWDRKAIEERVHKTAEMLKLEPLLHRYPNELSGGQQQRTALARAVVKKSRMVFLDEPLVNLDYKLREELRDSLPALFSDQDTYVFFATSEPGDALRLGGHTLLLHLGKVVQYGKTHQVYAKPVNSIASSIFSDPPINLVPFSKQGSVAQFASGMRWPLIPKYSNLADGAYTLGIRPHEVTPQQKEESAIPLKGTIQIIEISGSESIAHFNVEGTSWISLASGIQTFQVGEEHTFFFNQEHGFIFSPDDQLIEGS